MIQPTAPIAPAMDVITHHLNSLVRRADRPRDAALATLQPADMAVTDRESLWTLHNKINRKLLRTRLENP